MRKKKDDKKLPFNGRGQFCTSLFCILFLLAGCYRVPDQIDLKVDYQLQERHFSHLSSPFLPLSTEERETDWGKELWIAKGFAEELDLYRAVFTFKRAALLLKGTNPEHPRLPEIEYGIVRSFHLGKRYQEAVEAFERSSLPFVDKTFTAYHDLLLVLYEAYGEMKEETKQERILELLAKSYPVTGEKVRLSEALREGDLSLIASFSKDFPQQPSYLEPLLLSYQEEKKSVATAQVLNALCPGAGYLYIGQKRSALTALLVNGLFITAAVQFFLHGHLAAGIITTGFEAGWYFGGIYGAGEEAKYYNERLYEKKATSLLHEKELFPVLMLEHRF